MPKIQASQNGLGCGMHSIVPIYRKKSPQDRQKKLGTSLLSVAAKMYDKALIDPVVESSESRIGYKQCGCSRTNVWENEREENCNFPNVH